MTGDSSVRNGRAPNARRGSVRACAREGDAARHARERGTPARPASGRRGHDTTSCGPSCPTAPRAVASRARVTVKPATDSATPSEPHADVGEPRRGSETHLIFAPVEVAGFLRLKGSARHGVARGRETAARALLPGRAGARTITRAFEIFIRRIDGHGLKNRGNRRRSRSYGAQSQHSKNTCSYKAMGSSPRNSHDEPTRTTWPPAPCPPSSSSV